MVTGRQCFPESRSLITFARVKPDIAVYQLIVAAAHAGGGHFERSVRARQIQRHDSGDDQPDADDLRHRYR
jgi:hypothetical protein